jgi:hypothetical protein
MLVEKVLVALYFWMGLLSGSRDHGRNSTIQNLTTGESLNAQAHLGADIEVFMLTGNYGTECAYFRGTSSGPILFDLLFRLRKLELHAG